MTPSPDTAGEARACEVLLCYGLHPEARAVVKQRYLDWMAHAKGCRRRALSYRRDAYAYPAGSRDFEYYRTRANDQWSKAKDALIHARRERDTL